MFRDTRDILLSFRAYNYIHIQTTLLQGCFDARGSYLMPVGAVIRC